MSTKIPKNSVSKATYSSRSSSVTKASTKSTKTKTTSKAVAKKIEKSADSKEDRKSKRTSNVLGGNIGILTGPIAVVVNRNDLNQNFAANNNSNNNNFTYIPPENNYVPSTSNTSMIYNSSGRRSTYTPENSQPQKINDKNQSSNSVYLDRPKSVETSTKTTQSKNISMGVALASTDRPAESYPTPKEEWEAAKKQQQYALKYPKIVTTVPPKIVKPKKKAKTL